VFAALVVLKLGALLMLGESGPVGRNSDVNVYLEMAWNSWSEGFPGSRVTGSYPPVYPLAIAPTFGLPTNALRFDAIYLLHGLWFALACGLWVPVLRERLGPVAGWTVAGAAQLGGAALLSGYNPQSEALYGPLLVALGGVLAATPTAGRWVAAGALAGLAVGTRRMGLAAAVGVVAAGFGDRRALWALPGFMLGCLPEVVVSRFGAGVSAYSGNPAEAHLQWGAKALTSPAGAWLLLRTLARHAGYSLAMTFGAPLLLALVWRERVARFALAAWAATVGMASLHIVRYRLRTGQPGWDLYPRYLDPLEAVLLLAAIAVGLRGRLPRWLAATGLAVVVLSAPIARTRGGRLMAAGWGGEDVAMWLWPAIFAAAVLVAGALATRGRLRWNTLLAGSLLVSVGLSAPSFGTRFVMPLPAPPRVILEAPVAGAVDRPLLILVARPGPYGRRYLRPAFRSDHRPRFIAPADLAAAVAEQPTAFVLQHRKDPQPRGLRLVAKRGTWWVWVRD